MKAKMMRLSLPMVAIIAILLGTLLGGIVAYAHEAGPFDLTYGDCDLNPYGVGHSTVEYSFLQNADLWCNNYDQIRIDMVRQWGGWSLYDSTVFWGIYGYTDDMFPNYDTYGTWYDIPVEDIDQYAYFSPSKYYSVSSTNKYHFETWIWMYEPAYHTATEGWSVVP